MSSSFISQFGETLLNPSTKAEVSPTEALAGKDNVMLYFSAHWCPPCRRFTPLLIALYNKLKAADKNFELIFCSLDNAENEYNEYTADMPWLCMPFEAKESKILAGKYKAEGIPHLVVVDGAGEVITMDGTAAVGEDAEGKNFPWKPKSFGELWPDQILVSKGGGGGEGEGSSDEFLSSDEIKDKYLMLYFSASWCPPCRTFTPKLSEAYTKMKALRSDFECVFVSSDRDEESFNDYFSKKMSFCALPYAEHRDTKAALSKMFGVSGIPALVMLGPADEGGARPLINANMRSFIDSGEFSAFPFHKKNYGDVNDSEELNEVKSLIIFCENGDDEEQDEIKEIVKQVAAKLAENKEEEKMNVHWVVSPKGIGTQIRSLTKLPAPNMSLDPIMVLLDIPEQGAYYKSDVTDITVENVMKFLDCPGERLQLGN